jgi:fructose-1,6-bisphosphatase/inositol monophosphatase family enzyme
VQFSLPFDPAQAVAIVQQASALAMSLRGHVTPDIKADQTLVTEADRQIEIFCANT